MYLDRTCVLTLAEWSVPVKVFIMTAAGESGRRSGHEGILLVEPEM
jgi:hypothetical protein